jgi:hypothetical protein
MLAVNSAGEDRTYEGSGEMGVLSSTNRSDRARFNAISVVVEGCTARVATGVRR